MYMHTLARFCESQWCFFSLLSLKYITYSFSVLSLLPLCSLPAAVSPLRSPPPPLPQARGHPCPSLLPSACPPDACSCCRVSPVVWRLSCLVPFPFSPFVPIGRAPEAPRRPSVCPAVCPAPAVTRQPSGAKRCDSVGRCTACMSPALSPPAYVLPLLVPWLVLPAAVCRLVVTIAYTPLYPGRRRCGAASGV